MGRKRYRVRLVPVSSRIKCDPVQKKTGRRKKEKNVIGGSDGSEARGKRMGFNIADSRRSPNGDSYNGARGLAKPYRLWVRDSTE